MTQLNRSTTTAHEYEAVGHLLASPSIAARCEPYVGDGEFDWAGLLAEAQTMSGGEALLVRIGHDLWEGTGGVRIAELVRRLDAPSFERLTHALQLCRSGIAAPAEARLADAA